MLSNNISYLLIIGLFLSSCQTEVNSPTNERPETSVETVQPKRFFSDNSFWNQPIPADAEIDPRTEHWVKLLESEPTGEHFATMWSSWTIPVYEATINTPTFHVDYHQLSESEQTTWLTVAKRKQFGHGPNFNPVPIPEGTKPDPEKDAHFAIIDWARMLAWDMWGLKMREDGTWESKTGMCYRLDSDGTFDGYKLGYVDGESVHFHGPGRAAGVPIFAGLIMYDEVMSGKISHKLSCATRFAGKREFVYPASWTDGFTDGGIPEGAVIRLDPTLDLAPFNLTKEEIVVATALQEYGMVIVDVAQGQPIYAEGLWGHPDKSWEGKLSEWDGGINNIPFEHYQIMKIENTIQKGDRRYENIPLFENDY